jgi:3-dehydroquinate synthetase
VQLPYDENEVLTAIKMDKKRDGDHIKFVLLSEIGRAFVDDVPIQELVDLVRS